MMRLRRETMAQDISNSMQEELLDILGRNAPSAESSTLPQHEALLAELAAERRTAELLGKEVEICRRELSEYRTKLQSTLEANERNLASELDTLQMELESSQEDCRSHNQELETLGQREGQARIQLELQLQEALQESTNLQTELEVPRIQSPSPILLLFPLVNLFKSVIPLCAMSAEPVLSYSHGVASQHSFSTLVY